MSLSFQGAPPLLPTVALLFLLAAPSSDAFLQIPSVHPSLSASPAINVLGRASSRGLAAGIRRGVPSRLRMSAEEVDYVVVGGGISGMATAHFLEKAGHKVILAEATEALGGNIITRSEEGFTWEDGPNTFQPGDAILDFLSAMGLESQLVSSNPKLPRFVYYDGAMFSLPSGGGPPKDLLKLLTPLGLARAAVGALLPTGVKSEDESIAQFFDRTLGPEVLEKLVDPFISTVYSGDPSKLSFKSVFPAIHKVAGDAGGFGGLVGSFIRGRIAAKKGPQAARTSSATLPKGSSGSLQGGLAAIPAAAAGALGDVRTSWKGVSLAKKGDGEGYVTTFSTPSGDKTVHSKGVAIATDPPAAALLLKAVAPSADAIATAVTAPPVWAVTFAYPCSAFREDIPCVADGRLAGFGVLIPRACKIETLGFQFISSLFPARAPPGQESLLAYIGGAQNPSVKDLTAEQVMSKVDADARRVLLKPDAPPPTVLSCLLWPHAIPQYNRGHAAATDKIRAELPDGVVMASSFAGGGIALGDCVTRAKQCAEQLQR